MSERTSTITSHRHEEFYSKKLFTTRKYTSYISDSVDRVDACINEKKFNGHHEISHEKVELNGHTNGHTNGTTKIETKSFIQQRVERLYGPGALAQGFFVMKRQKSRLSESDAQIENGTNLDVSTDKHSKSMSDKLLLDDGDNTMKQSASSPSLPVLRHLTPEFRAQLPTFSPRRGVDTIQKSTTLPQLKDVNIIKPEVIINGKKHHNSMNMNNNVNGSSTIANDCIADNLAINKLEVKDSAIVPEEDVKDGHYFLKILEGETARLLSMADRAEEELDAGEGQLSENAKGFLRSASGKARLLVSQKMQQFKGLCTNNLTQADGEAFPTTNQDLQGFWDMVMLQVDQIDSIFKELDVLRANNWQEVEKERSEEKVNKPKTRISAPSARLRSAGAEEARAKRELERKQMLEQRRRAMREAKNSSEKSIEIFVPESS